MSDRLQYGDEQDYDNITSATDDGDEYSPTDVSEHEDEWLPTTTDSGESEPTETQNEPAESTPPEAVAEFEERLQNQRAAYEAALNEQGERLAEAVGVEPAGDDGGLSSEQKAAGVAGLAVVAAIGGRYAGYL